MNSLFARIMAVVLSVVLAMAVALSVMAYFSIRDQRVASRLDYLAAEAEEIAILAADLDGSGEICIEADELAEAGWFDRSELPADHSPISLTGEMIELFRSGRKTARFKDAQQRAAFFRVHDLHLL